MKKLFIACAVVLGLLSGLQDACAKLTVGKMFSDNMVLQREMPVPVWGTADAGDKVTVEFAGQKKVATADADGKWSVKLDALKTSDKPAEMKVSTSSSDDAVTFANVLVGEVWIGSGQSNMAGGTGGYARNDEVLASMAKGGPYPTLRLYQNGWKVADETTANRFSALHFAFGRSLHEKLGVPVGLMVGAAGGTPSGRWLSEEMAKADPALVKMLKEKGGYDLLAKEPAERKFRIGDLYMRFIEPMRPYAIRGVLWDQGESKTQLPGVDQITTMNALIRDWRKAWGQGDFPFLHVQKPSGEGCAWDPKDPMNLRAVPFAKLPNHHNNRPNSMKYELDHIKMGTLKNAPLVTASDLAPGIHPQTKSSYGKRACQVALGAVYGQDVAICGPVYKSHKIEGKTIRVEFDHVGKGLAWRHGENLQGFEIAGEDGKLVWADAKIDGNSVIVSSPDVEKPVTVQYAFSRRHSFANLFNKDGLPALMFTTAK